MTAGYIREDGAIAKYHSELAVLACEKTCFIDEEAPEIAYKGSAKLKIWDCPLKRKIAFIEFDLDPLKGKKVRRAYLRLVNDEGHDWNATASIAVGEMPFLWTPSATWHTGDGHVPWDAPGGIQGKKEKSIEKTVFRVPEWQPTWFIDITPIVSGWMEAGKENHGICLSGGIKDQPLNIKCNTAHPGLNPMLLVVYSCEVSGNGALTPEQKLRNAFEALSQIYVARDISWSGSFVRNAQANADLLGWGQEYLKSLKIYFDLCIADDGGFRNVSEEYFYVGSCGQALIHLYKTTGMGKYRRALKTLRDALHNLPRSSGGIITAGGRVEVELIFCVCAFLAFYHDKFDDRESRDLALEQAISIFDVMMFNQPDGIPLQNLERPLSKGWSRGMGWMTAGMGKLISSPGIKASEKYEELVKRFKSLSEILSGYQKPNGLWRSIVQDVNKPEEVTGSALIALGYEYGFQQGILDASYRTRVDHTLNGILKYTRTGIDMGNSFPMNFYERYEVTDFSGNSDQGYGAWMELVTVVSAR